MFFFLEGEGKGGLASVSEFVLQKNPNQKKKKKIEKRYIQKIHEKPNIYNF